VHPGRYSVPRGKQVGPGRRTRSVERKSTSVLKGKRYRVPGRDISEEWKRSGPAFRSRLQVFVPKVRPSPNQGLTFAFRRRGRLVHWT